MQEAIFYEKLQEMLQYLKRARELSEEAEKEICIEKKVELFREFNLQLNIFKKLEIQLRGNLCDLQGNLRDLQGNFSNNLHILMNNMKI